MAIYDAYGKEVRPGGPVLGELTSIDAMGWSHSSYPSQGLTPERLTSIFREADAGDIRRQAELFEEMEEKDAHLSSVLRTRALAVAGLGWEVVKSSENSEALGRVENFGETFTSLMGAVSRGFAVSEIIWELAGGSAWVKGLKSIEQKHFTFAVRAGAGVGVSRTPKLLTSAEPSWGEDLLPGKFLVHTAPGRTGLSHRGGLMRACGYMYLFKNYTLKDWVVFNERFAMPMRIGRFGPGTSEADRRVLKQAVFNLATDAAAIISDSTEIELLESASKSASGDLYAGLAEFCDRSYSKAVLGQTLTTEQTQGTYATAKVHQGVRQDILAADARALGSAISAQLIGPLVEYNFGPDAKRPLFKFQYEPKEDLKTLADTYAVLVRDVGLGSIPAAHIHERFGIPHKEEEGGGAR